ncbi:exopolyphosphatase [Alkaliphilus hydrothermalis]|uniref:Exopolyphosphatase n=1 Tax=Alkaliphilus hydrothermalis TaxID=1482730 RepID=A0ABS2NP25_9FIRM|nr:exopolyphosphatase [Alkaliphilus hydrothermalis]MBM7614693.1 exopolyphosphatase/guanosine-5'-triphosphate,3'-diphosphate pyrophosphatase [Alkaliphilus hydrothermalis]
MEKKFAIIDLGSNSVRMIIMKIDQDHSYRMIDEAKEMVRLSEGMGREMILKPTPIKRTIKALKLFKKLLEVHHVDEVFLVATAAVRNAINQKEFLQIVYTETGFEFEVITGEKEGYYAYLGVINTIDINECVIIDVGGGSTELVLVENRQIKEAISFPFGAVILTEGYLDRKQESTEKMKQLEEYIAKQFKKVDWLKKAVGLPVVGIGGTARTLAKINKNEIEFPLTSLHNYQITSKEMIAAFNKVSKAKIHERKNIPGVNKERADIIVGGIVPIKCLVEYLKADKLIISGNGLREGVFFEKYILECYPVNRLLKDVLHHSINNVLRNYDANIIHSYHIRKLALSIFDQMTDLHGLGKEERKLLSAAALLHDIGNYVDYYNHQKHGFYLVLNSRLNGLRNRELVMCAFIVAMHREVDFRRDWKSYSMLISKKDFEIIIKLSIFLNIAEKLDRSEARIIEDVECLIEGERVQIKVKSATSPELEICTAYKVQKAFKKAFNRDLEII